MVCDKLSPPKKRLLSSISNRLFIHCIPDHAPFKVYTTMFYMGKFNGPSPKRHRLWSNDSGLLDLIGSRAGYMSRIEQAACPVRTARTYYDKRGVKRRVGNKEALRDSQTLFSTINGFTI